MNATDESPADRPPTDRSLGAVLAWHVRRRGQQPLLTFYDHGSGERTELSYATLHNWSSKTANLLVEELALRRHGLVSVRGVDHWTGVAIAVAAWQVGACVDIGRDTDASVVVVAEDLVDDVDDASRLVAVGTGPGGRLTRAVPCIGYGDEVLAFADDYDDPAVTLDDAALGDLTHGDLLRLGWGTLQPHDRLLVTGGLDDAARAAATALACGAALVWCVQTPGEAIAATAASERVTHAFDHSEIAPYVG